MKFTRAANRLYIAKDTLVIGQRAHTTIIRVDGTEGAYRVDRSGTLHYVWEAIDGGVGFGTKAQAETSARTWCRLAVQQKTLHPTTGRENGQGA